MLVTVVFRTWIAVCVFFDDLTHAVRIPRSSLTQFIQSDAAEEKAASGHLAADKFEFYIPPKPVNLPIPSISPILATSRQAFEWSSSDRFWSKSNREELVGAKPALKKDADKFVLSDADGVREKAKTGNKTGSALKAPRKGAHRTPSSNEEALVRESLELAWDAYEQRSWEHIFFEETLNMTNVDDEAWKRRCVAILVEMGEYLEAAQLYEIEGAYKNKMIVIVNDVNRMDLRSVLEHLQALEEELRALTATKSDLSYIALVRGVEVYESTTQSRPFTSFGASAQLVNLVERAGRTLEHTRQSSDSLKRALKLVLSAYLEFHFRALRIGLRLSDN